MNKTTIIGLWMLAVILLNAFFIMNAPQHITGAVTARLFVISTQSFNDHKIFVESWNLISLPAIPNNSTVDGALNLYPNYTSIHTYAQLDTTDEWKAYNPNISASAVQDLNNISEKKGYWINMKNKSQFTLSGTMEAVTQIQVYQGWNLVGYPINVTKTITSAFTSINGSYAAIYAYYANDTTDPWKVYNPSIAPQFSDLTAAYPFYGYWVNATSNATITITT